MLSDPQQGANPALPTIPQVPFAADGIGATSMLDASMVMPQRRGRAVDLMSANNSLPDPATISALRELQRQRQFCIVSQSRCDRSCEAFIARYLGFKADQDEVDRKKVWAQATAFRRAVEKGGEGQSSFGDQLRDALAACTPIILNSVAARDMWDKHRSQVEKQMRKLVRGLPAWKWVEQVRGFGDLGLAIIIGETGDLSGYATKERVWKRLGLAVIEGERQQRKSGAEAAAAHGYNPKRRAEIWTIADSMFRAQWRGAKDDQPAQPIGPYGAVYGRRKTHTVTREWSPKHRDNDARRVMTKALVEDLWRVWRWLPPLAAFPLDRPREA